MINKTTVWMTVKIVSGLVVVIGGTYKIIKHKKEEKAEKKEQNEEATK